MSETVSLTVAQATVEFLAHQYSERDGVTQKLFAGALGIFGHGNVAGIGQALLQQETSALAAGETPGLPYVLARNEQAMVHTAVGYARQKDRLQTWVCTASVGPGSTNMLTGAALATINRIPVLLLPSGTFATRRSAPVLQELENFAAGDVTVNDAFRPLSTYFDRVSRAEQLPSALLSAMRVLTDPAQTGAVTLSLPQDVQAEAYDWPVELFADRTWHVARPPAEKSRIQAAADLIRGARRPMIVAGGGVHYSGAEDALAAFCEATGIPVGESQAGKGSLLHGHPQLMGAVGSTGTTAANALAREADLIIGIGTRWSDFTTASRTAFQAAGVRFINVNVANFDAGKQSGLAVVADAREALEDLTAALDGWSVDAAYRAEQGRLWAVWDAAVESAYQPGSEVTDALAPGKLTQGTVLGLVNELTDPRDVVLCAAGSMPGDLHKLWRVRDRRGYHVEYGYSCMGYEVPASIGIRLADETRDVFAMLGDGGYLMMPTELVTAVQERVKVVVVLVQNHGFHSIGSLSESLGSQRFGTRYRFRGTDSHRLDGDTLPVDLAANARSLGVTVIEVHSRDELAKAIRTAKDAPADGGPILIHVETDPLIHAPDSESWWDVPVSEVSTLDSTAAAYATYLQHRRQQRHHL
ncbi:3D-(3,5/4)-trihydroxycyclohexane-1,2-dione acylhydrolase (decyclizing) [Actinoplanes couchii]|uniref:3D-(3,5/4)-trihydroxycyclohexane-1,2-dione acylhydrolase (Decyclizing) n=1 Tax=Actinoplanes couchii TaxID=403638 RepID=A0ABQ3XHN1_9ACTN|nr:3D-(3,5/4)-trihydroxycyclohexane-1,2-dione acylhydrolase (decyclizing) [Actinoplanes couchii]MDR6317533.1 3D-(3,5/4)-trihydroxycyclohexane-1,2-dione acylhydrolase (decyclizing) [Actinoplanes couchii]GID57915.1 3D-(3,5/4)-trihydroxycyclohexane-1,2-dione acylhydrolase (decyclizing) [Actinoplanes couchii]